MKNIKDAILWLFSIICGVFLAYLLIGGIIKKQSLDKNLEYSKAIVIDLSSPSNILITSAMNFS